jgi:hypothetical protein
MPLETTHPAYAKWSLAVFAVAAVTGCSTRRGAPTDSGRSPPELEVPVVAAESDEAPEAEGARDRDRCYPYLAKSDGVCPTECASIDDCAGSRGPADFAENGWPLDCINRECVPLPPDAVEME